MSPQPESKGVCIAGGAGLKAFKVLGCVLGGGGAVWAGGSGDAQASLEPQASTLLRLEKLEAWGRGGEVWVGFCGWERLKALFEA